MLKGRGSGYYFFLRGESALRYLENMGFSSQKSGGWAAWKERFWIELYSCWFYWSFLLDINRVTCWLPMIFLLTISIIIHPLSLENHFPFPHLPVHPHVKPKCGHVIWMGAAIPLLDSVTLTSVTESKSI